MKRLVYFFSNRACGRERIFVFLVTPLLFAALGAFLFVVVLRPPVETPASLALNQATPGPVATPQPVEPTPQKAVEADTAPLEPRALQELLLVVEQREAAALSAGTPLEEIVAAFRKITRRNPECARAWAGVGRILVSAGQYSDAVIALNRACELDILNADYLNVRSTARRGAGDVRGAFADCISSLRIQPHDPIVSNRMLFFSLELGGAQLFDAKLATFSGSLDNAPDPRTIVACAVRDARAGEMESAVALLTKAREILPPESFTTLLKDRLFADTRGAALIARFEAGLQTASASIAVSEKP